MHPLIYDVAVSLDGYISGPDGDISHFVQNGPVVDAYHARLAGYTVAIIGRATYAFGYQYGLAPGQNPYPHMDTHVFSDTLTCPQDRAITLHPRATKDTILALKRRAAGPVYLCGGGAFAGWLLNAGLIDRVLLKRAPCLYGAGVPLFGGVGAPRTLTRVATTQSASGYQLEDYRL